MSITMEVLNALEDLRKAGCKLIKATLESNEEHDEYLEGESIDPNVQYLNLFFQNAGSRGRHDRSVFALALCTIFSKAMKMRYGSQDNKDRMSSCSSAIPPRMYQRFSYVDEQEFADGVDDFEPSEDTLKMLCMDLQSIPGQNGGRCAIHKVVLDIKEDMDSEDDQVRTAMHAKDTKVEHGTICSLFVHFLGTG